MGFSINGAAMLIAPYNQLWVDLIEGTDHTGRPVYAGTKNVDLSFDNTTLTNYRQFSVLNGTSLTSIQILNIDGGSYTTYTNVGIDLIIKSRPQFDAGNVTKFVVSITGIVP